MTDRVQPIWPRLRTLESAGFPASGRAALAETLCGTGPVAAKSLGPGLRPRTLANPLVLAPCAGFVPNPVGRRLDPRRPSPSDDSSEYGQLATLGLESGYTGHRALAPGEVTSPD